MTFSTGGSQPLKRRMNLVSIAVTKGDVPDEARREFLIATKGVEFLFNQEVADYCEALAKESVNVRVGEMMLETLPLGERRTKSAEAWADRMVWFTNQLDEIKKRFGPFLKIEG
jgi:hypothetical protein